MQSKHNVDLFSADQPPTGLVELQIAALEATANAVVITDRTATVLWANSAFERLTGYSRAEIVGQSMRLLRSGRNPQALYREMWQTILGGRIWRGELVNRRKDGSHYQEEMTITPVKDGTGEITHFIAIKLDISERRQAEAALRSLSDRLSLATAVAKIGVWELDLATNVFTWDATLFEIYGFPPLVPIPYEKWSTTVYPQDLPAVEAALRKIIGEKGQGFAEFRIIRTDGAVRNVLAVGKAVLDEQARISRVVGTTQDITDRKQAENRLQESEAKHRVLFEDSSDAHLLSDENGFVDCNSALLRMFGYANLAELTGLRPADLSPPNQPDGTPSQAGVDREMATTFLKGANSFEWLHRRKSGELFPAEVYLTALTLKGRPALLGTVRDITERRRAEASLRNSEEQFRQLADNILEVFFVVEPEPLRMAYLSPAYEEIWGRPRQEVYDRPAAWIESVHPEDRQAVSADFARSMQGVRGGLTYRIVRPDGSIRWIHARSSPVHDPQGKFIRLVGIAEDITNFKTAQLALEESEERARLLLESTAEAIYGINLEGDCTFCNAACVRMLGYVGPAELLGKNMHATMHHSYPDGTRYPVEACQIYLAFRENKGSHVENEVLWRKDGSCFPAEYWSFPIKREGQLIGSVVTFLDITDRKKAEAELLKAKEGAEAANRAKSEFLANMSHEIRTPMNGIIGMTGLALETELTPDQAEYLHMVKGSADALLSLLNDILDFSKVESGKLELDCLSFNLRKSLGEAVKALAIKAQQNGLEVVFDVAPEVPATVLGDPARLRQVLVNLVGNSIKFTQAGEIEVNVQVKAPTQGQNVQGVALLFSVRDTGIGIPLDKQRSIFDAFSQADSSTTRKYGGTGLGLTIASQLVRLMGGNLWVESEAGRGSTFYFTVQVGLGDAESPRDSLAKTLDISQCAGVPVLVVDDNATNRRILEDSLRNWKMMPTVVDSAAAAIRALRRVQESHSPLPLLLTDAHMPEMDGFGLVERIRQDPSLNNIKIVVLTSGGRRGDAALCRTLGVNAYLSKPFDRLELRELLLRVLAGDSARPESAALVTRHSLRDQAKSLCFLVAEDNVVNQKLIARLLEKRGHTVVVARNGWEALALWEQRPFDIVLMDVMMPEMDGFEATRRIREKEKASGAHLPIIALTAHAMRGDREQCLAAGMDGYVSKPINMEELFSVIENLLSPINPNSMVSSLTEKTGGD